MIRGSIIFNCNSKWPKEEESQRKGRQRRHKRQRISRKHTRRLSKWQCRRPKPTSRPSPNMNNLNMFHNAGNGSGRWALRKPRKWSS